MAISNPVFNDLTSCGLVKRNNLEIISKSTRNAKINVIRENIEGIIFLEKYLTSKKYYKKKYKSKLKKGRFYSETKFLDGKKFLNKRVDDDKRRVKDFNKLIKNKIICDFGCGFGGFLKQSSKITKKFYGVELGENCTKYLRINNIINQNYIDDFDFKFDLITLFHTLHYIPDQIETLKKIKKKLKKNGKIIIEVPHANDLLLSKNTLPDFKKFTFCKESLIWHTEKSLKSFLKKAGYKNTKVSFFQRYEFENHLGWLLKNKPGGHNYFQNKISSKLKSSYNEFLVKNKLTDTLIAVAGI